jgi:tRNA pseudouridine-54 N-methylase
MCCINNPATRCYFTQARAKEIPIFIFRRHCKLSHQQLESLTQSGRKAVSQQFFFSITCALIELIL